MQIVHNFRRLEVVQKKYVPGHKFDFYHNETMCTLNIYLEKSTNQQKRRRVCFFITRNNRAV